MDYTVSCHLLKYALNLCHSDIDEAFICFIFSKKDKSNNAIQLDAI